MTNSTFISLVKRTEKTCRACNSTISSNGGVISGFQLLMLLNQDMIFNSKHFLLHVNITDQKKKAKDPIRSNSTTNFSITFDLPFQIFSPPCNTVVVPTSILRRSEHMLSFIFSAYQKHHRTIISIFQIEQQGDEVYLPKPTWPIGVQIKTKLLPTHTRADTLFLLENAQARS